MILPDHLHMIWTLPEGDPDFPLRWRLIKSAFSHRLPGGERISPSRAAKGERGFGSGGIGSAPCVTRKILSGTAITFTLIRSNTGMRFVRGIGPIPRFTAG